VSKPAFQQLRPAEVFVRALWSRASRSAAEKGSGKLCVTNAAVTFSFCRTELRPVHLQQQHWQLG